MNVPEKQLHQDNRQPFFVVNGKVHSQNEVRIRKTKKVVKGIPCSNMREFDAVMRGI